MSSQASFGTSLLFQSMNDELNASLATADELSREFSSLLKEASSDEKSPSGSQTTSTLSYEKPQISTPSYTRESSGSNSSTSSQPFSPSPSSFNPSDSVFSNNLAIPKTSVYPSSPLSSPKINRRSPLPQIGNDGYSHLPQQAPRSPRLSPSSHFDRNPQGLISHHERSPSPNPAAYDQSPRSPLYHPLSHHLNPYDNSSLGRRSPRPDRSPSRLAANPISNTLPRNFGYRTTDEGVQRQKSPGKWNETDLDVSYERKPHHTYDKTEWVRQSVPNSSWRESNLDGPPPSPSPKKDPRSKPLHYAHASLPRNTRISVPPDVSSPVHSPYHPQPIISRISIPPTSSQSRQHKPIPLSVIMRLQNPRWGALVDRHPRALGRDGDRGPYNPPPPIPRDFFHQPVVLPKQRPDELRQPTIYSDALNPGDIDAEIERLDFVQTLPVISENPNMPEANTEASQSPSTAPRPLSPTRLQPVVAPEAQTQVVADMEELLRIRAEIPRALKRRGSIDLGSQKRASHYQPNQYKNLIDKLFRKKEHGQKGEQRGDQSSDTSSSSDGEDTAAMPPAPPPSSQTSRISQSYHSILRRSNREQKTSGKRARLSPLVLALDGSLVGELETVQKAMQEMSDPSHPNDEGITALHNAICGGHYSVVDFLVRIGANVSAPDSHGWTPLHCAASCNDRPLCEFLVRNGAAVMAVTESDTATASQKCDPFAVGFEECESFLKGVEEAMGVENSGVLYALWSYPAQAADELSFKDGDMVTILQKPEGSDWWWASLCGREGFVPNNYFGLFPKTRPKSLC